MVSERAHGRIGRAIDSILSGPNWKSKALLAVLTIALFRAFPGYDALRTQFVEAKWQYAQFKFDHPLADTSRIFPPGSHESNVTFRVTVPAFAHVLHLRRTGVLIFFAAMGVLLLYVVLNTTYRLTASRKAALFVCLSTACVWAGEAGFHELRGGYYDAVALCLLILALRVESPQLTAIFVFLAAWTDERALAASPFLLLTGKARVTLIAAAGYLGTRLLLTMMHPYSAGVSGLGLSVLARQAKMLPMAVWGGLAGGWIIVAAALLTLCRQKRYAMAAGFCAAFAAVMGSALLVVDVTRSMAYCLPAVLAGVTVLSRADSAGKWRMEKLASAAALVSFVSPAYYIEGTGLWWLYPLPVQIMRWLL
jgi:hypothetical protein